MSQQEQNVVEQYKATWGDSYEKPGTRVVGLDFFGDADLGYDEEDLQAVKALNVGDTVKLDAGDHSVTRIE
jgi:hypothetical protein